MSDDMNELSAEITRLVEEWCVYTSFDHCKDRDKHWGIDVSWSYGLSPTFTGWHHGYVAERWIGPRRRRMEDAMKDVLVQLKKTMRNAYNWASSVDLDEEYMVEPDQVKFALENFSPQKLFQS